MEPTPLLCGLSWFFLIFKVFCSIFWNYSHGIFGFVFLNVILFILDCIETDHMAKQACAAYLLREGHEIGTVIQHFMYLFLLEWPAFHTLNFSILFSYGTSRKGCDKCSKQGIYMHIKCSWSVHCEKKVLPPLLNNFRLITFLLHCTVLVFYFMLKWQKKYNYFLWILIKACCMYRGQFSIFGILH